MGTIGVKARMFIAPGFVAAWSHVLEGRDRAVAVDLLIWTSVNLHVRFWTVRTSCY